MRSYVLKKITGTPDWNAIEALPIDNLQWTPPVDIRAQGQLCWDDEAIYVRLRAWEKEIRAEQSGLMQMPCEDSCLEFFLRPGEDLRYLNFEMNPNCALYLGYGTKIQTLTRLVVKDEQALFAPQAERLDDGWAITYRVPFAFIREFFPDFTPHVGLAMYGNCYKCGDLTVQEHYLSWNPMQCDAPAFHRPQDFGRLILGD